MLFELKKNWYCIILLAVIFMVITVIFVHNNSANIKKNSCFMGSVDLYIENMELSGNEGQELEKILKSNQFIDNAYDNQDIDLKKNEYPHFYIRQNAKWNDAYDITISFTAKTKEEIEDMILAISISGKDLLEDMFEVKVNVIYSIDGMKKVVVAEGADINSAILYDDYHNTRLFNLKNVVLWGSMCIILSLAINILYAGLRMKFRLLTDMGGYIKGGYIDQTKKLSDNTMLVDIVSQHDDGKKLIIYLNMAQNENMLDILKEYLCDNEKNIRVIEDIQLSHKKNIGEKEKIYIYDLMKYIGEISEGYVILKTKSMTVVKNILTIIGKEAYVIISIGTNQYTVKEIRKIYEELYQYMGQAGRISIVLDQNEKDKRKRNG